jgi:hypothetical protein
MFNWLKKLFGMEIYEEPIDRDYHFSLPYKLSASNVMYAIRLLKSKDVWYDIPSDLRMKMEHAKEKWRPIKISKDDLDRLNDKTWKLVADKLNLKWSD